MAHYVASATTAGPVPAIHAGVNVQINTFTLNETASGSTTIAIAALPAGARVVDVKVMGNHANLQATAGAQVSVYSTIGGTKVADYLSSVTYAVFMSGDDNDFGTRMTGSANLIMRLSECAGTGTGSTQFTVVTSYLADQRGD